MSYVIFENPGELDIRALQTFGVSVKESENAIGYFGTGLKYATAILLRESCSVTVFSGDISYEFTTKEEVIRNEPFQVIHMNDTPLGFTTELGKNWKLWMAYRELYSNCVDEGGSIYESFLPPEPEQGKTFIVVKGSSFLDVHFNKDMYILSEKEEPIITTEVADFYHPRTHSLVFYRGILVGTFNEPASYTYNIKKKIYLSEERIATERTIQEKICEAVMELEDPSQIIPFILQNQGRAEDYLPFPAFGKYNEAFREAARKVYDRNPADLSVRVKAIFQSDFKKAKTSKRLEPTPVQQKQLDRAKKFALSLGFSPEDYPIQIVEDLGDGILGYAEDNTILISLLAFDRGTKAVVGTLIEEYLHLRYNLYDESRAMQNFLLDKIVSLGEELSGDPI